MIMNKVIILIMIIISNDINIININEIIVMCVILM